MCEIQDCDDAVEHDPEDENEQCAPVVDPQIFFGDIISVLCRYIILRELFLTSHAFESQGKVFHEHFDHEYRPYEHSEDSGCREVTDQFLC